MTQQWLKIAKKRVFQRFKAWHGAENMIKYIFEEKILLGSFPDTSLGAYLGALCHRPQISRDFCHHNSSKDCVSNQNSDLGAPNQGPQIIELESTTCQLSQELKIKCVSIVDQFLEVEVWHRWKNACFLLNLDSGQLSKKYSGCIFANF